MINVSYGIDAPETPDAVKLCSGEVLFQSRLLLEAVGRDSDAAIKPIDDMDIKPSDGWEKEDPQAFTNVAEEHQELAKSTVFRWYRIKSQADESLAVPGYTGVVSNITQCLPLRKTLLETYESPDGIVYAQSAFVTGQVFRGEDNAPQNDNTGDDWTRVTTPFRILADEGIVVFSQPVHKIEDDGNPPATLYLTTSYTVRDETSKQTVRYAYEKQLRDPPIGVGVEIVRDDNIQLRFRAEYGEDSHSVSQVVSNENEAETAALAVLNARSLEYAFGEAYAVHYRGIKPFFLDGTVRQLAWSISDSKGATTFASINSETDPYVVRYHHRRRRRQWDHRVPNSLAQRGEEPEQEAEA